MVRLYSLLFISPILSRVINTSNTALDVISLFVLNAISLADSASRHNLRLTVVCNDIASLNELCGKFLAGKQRPFDVISLDASFELPADIGFAAAHYKLDAMRAIAADKPDYAVMIDLDVYCCANNFDRLQSMASGRLSACYDISAQVLPAYSFSTVAKDIRRLSPNAVNFAWIGGEFIAGDWNFFHLLQATCFSFLPEYLKQWRNLHHQGDEALLTVAVEKLRSDGVNIIDAGAIGVIKRYWTGSIRHAQLGLNDTVKEALFLHLPQEKHTLASLALIARDLAVAERDIYLFRRVSWRHFVRALVQRVRITLGKPINK